MNKTSHTALAIVALLMPLCFLGCKGKIEVKAAMAVSAEELPAPTLKVFIENSGSMDGYMCDGSELKDAVYDYVGNLNPYVDTTELYYINSQTIPYAKDLRSYVLDLNPASFHKAGGNTSNTNLGDIIKSVVDQTAPTDVSIFISDCILDLPNANATDFLTHCQIDIKNSIANAIKGNAKFAVEILRMESRFKGKYFSSNGGIVKLDTVRPYYMWIFGDARMLAALNAKVPLADIKKGYTHMAAFANCMDVPFSVTNTASAGTVVIENSGKYNMLLKADMMLTLQDDAEIMNPANYTTSAAGLKVVQVDKVSAADAYSHVLKVELDKNTPVVEAMVSMRHIGVPAWVSAYNDELGEDILSKNGKTTGILN